MNKHLPNRDITLCVLLILGSAWPCLAADDSPITEAEAVPTISWKDAGAFIDQYDAIMQRRYVGELVHDGAAASLVRACKQIGRRHVYRAPGIVRVEIMGQRILHDLMDLFSEAASAFEFNWLDDEGRVVSATHPAKIYSMISQNYRTVFEHALRSGDGPELYCRLQLVTDHIAGMTDTYACTLHRELTNA